MVSEVLLTNSPNQERIMAPDAPRGFARGAQLLDVSSMAEILNFSFHTGVGTEFSPGLSGVRSRSDTRGTYFPRQYKNLSDRISNLEPSTAGLPLNVLRSSRSFTASCSNSGFAARTNVRPSRVK